MKKVASNYSVEGWPGAVAAFVIGIAAWAVATTLPGGNAVAMAVWIYNKVGITIVALLPLATWSVWTAFCVGEAREDINATKQIEDTLSYIGTTAQRVGLLGTVIGIVAATISIGDSLNSGAANAVTSALPAVGQALVSTAVGFIIAIACDLFRFLYGVEKEVEK